MGSNNFDIWTHATVANSIHGDSVISVSSDTTLSNPNSCATNQQSNAVATVNSSSAPTNAITIPVSYIVSNGYYGFSYINPPIVVHNNTDNNLNQNNDIDRKEMLQDNDTSNVTMKNFDNSAAAAIRCKKRFYINNNDEQQQNASNSEQKIHSIDEANIVAAKRRRYDDDANNTAKYCNDVFSLPINQIGTQSCLMDIEDCDNQDQQQQQLQYVQFPDAIKPAQVDMTMEQCSIYKHNNDDDDDNVNVNCLHLRTLMEGEVSSLESPSAQTQVLSYSQQSDQLEHNLQQQPAQHFRGHLHRTNRDVSRCLLSHMI